MLTGKFKEAPSRGIIHCVTEAVPCKSEGRVSSWFVSSQVEGIH